MQNWSYVGPVRILNGLADVCYQFYSLEECCLFVKRCFIENTSEKSFENFIDLHCYHSWLNGHYDSSLDYHSHYIIVDENYLTVPKAIMLRICDELGLKNTYNTNYRFDYNPQKDFRNGPLKGRSKYNKSRGRRNRSQPGPRHRRFRFIHEKRWALAHNIELKEFGFSIRAKRNYQNIPNVRDDYPLTRYGNNWKRYRKHQWKEKSKYKK